MGSLDQYLSEEFDDRAVEPSKGIDGPVPAGDYNLQLEKGTIAYTKNGRGVLFKAQFAILEGDYSGRMIFAQYNIRNDNEQAQTIGIAEMKALTIACGLDWETVRADTDQLLFKPFAARIGFDREQTNPETGRTYAPRNRIMKYYAYDPALATTKTEAPKSAVPQRQPLPRHANPANNKLDDEVPF